uniref:Ig-like domain-containing protein n=1 Tax=Denticeps clupeoides TaxID=299321 RepID=A0AAY4CP48_9TELE
MKTELAKILLHASICFYTAVMQGINFPEFTAVGMMDGQQFDYYDSNIRQAIPKVDWIKNNVGPEYWSRNTQISQGTEPSFKVAIKTLMECFNQSGGIHTVQKMFGCELDDETGATDGYSQFGYDGADLISLDLRSTSYVAPVPQAAITKQKWDGATAEYTKNYLIQECIYWVKKYVQYGKISLERKVPPQVSLLQTDPSSPVVCHATGFYPDKVMISWQKDGQDLHEDVDVGETLPNHDGTFQKRAELKVTPDERKKNQFTCVVEHKSGDPIHMILTEEKIRTNSAGTGATTALELLTNPLTITSVDGHPVSSGPIIHRTVPLQLRLDSHVEKTQFLVTKIITSPLLLGLPWLSLHGPTSPWTSSVVSQKPMV